MRRLRGATARGTIILRLAIARGFSAWWTGDGLRDVVLVLALGLIGYGLAGWSRPLACVVVGGLLLALAWPPAAPGDPARRVE